MENGYIDKKESVFEIEQERSRDGNPSKKIKGISYWGAFANFFRTLLGPGCLALPVAFKDAGWLVSLIIIPIFGFLNAHCMTILVKASQYLSRKKGQGPLELNEVAFDACSNSFPSLKKYGNILRHTVNACTIGLQIGITSVYYVFVSVHSKEIVEKYTDIRLSDTVYMLLMFVPFVLVNSLRTLKVIAFLSGLGGILMCVSLIGIFQFLLRQPHLSFSDLIPINTFNGIVTASGAIIYAYEGQAVILPLENKIKKPHQMLGFSGIISTGISSVTVFYIINGFLGYITYGDKVEGSIALNLPDDPVYSTLKGLLIIVVFTGFALQQYVVIELTLPTVKNFVLESFEEQGSKILNFFIEVIYRAFLVLVCMVIAITVPNLEEIIPLVGITCGMMIALVFPPIIDTLIFLPKLVEEEDENVFYDEDENITPGVQDVNETPSPILRPLNEESEEQQEDRKEKFMYYAKMILPHVGLVVLLILYLFVGATYFYYVESAFELESKERELRTIFQLRDNFHENIWNLTHSTDNVISRESFNGIGQEYFERLVENIFISYRNQFITERHLLNRTKGDERLWTYPNSVFFATAVVSTIGYGNLVPVTTQGRIGCIVFALLGIPLLLVTIADIGKFLSEFLSFLYRTYRVFKRKTFLVGQRTRRFSTRYRDNSTSQSDDCSSPTKAGSVNLDDIDDDSNNGADIDELRIPVIMVLLVLLAYTAIGGFLFKAWEGWSYFEAFYFCFTTMATVGFGDLVPTESMYTFLTMVYIIFGLSLATMCIDLAGTEYLQKIHYLGKKMDDAKGAVLSGLEVGEHLFKHNGVGLIKTAGGKFLHIRLSNKQLEELMLNPEKHRDILREPLSTAVQRLADEHNIKILPDDIAESEGYILKNRDVNKPNKKRFGVINQYNIQRILIPGKNQTSPLLPFVLKESNI